MKPALRISARGQRGVTMLVVLVLMSVMLLGAMSLARLTEISTMAAGNSSFRDVGLQASEVGLNNGFAQLTALADPESDTGNWYFATMQVLDVNGLPQIDWTVVPATQVGAYDVRTVAERLCSAAPVSDPLQQCLVRQVQPNRTYQANDPSVDPPNAVQYRVTVRVVGPKGSQSWVQSLMTRG
jgi:type IV pilus assembly protein PilX